VAQLFLDVAFVDFGGAGEARPQGMPREQGEAFLFWQLASESSVQHGLLDQARNVLIA
tara:strand:- start:415 stop:588 length:174 start_codon:yes stop_codon:yes gene_type:complete